MGGGGTPPAPKTFVAPPLDNSPATNPVPNFFANRSPQVSPYQQFGQQPSAQPQNPFMGMSPVDIEALLKRIRGQG